MRYFTHPNGSVEQTPPKKKEMDEMNDRVSHDDNVAQGVNRLGYKCDQQQDPYKYKYYEYDNS